MKTELLMTVDYIINDEKRGKNSGRRLGMISELKILSNSVSWSFNDEEIIIRLNNVFFAAENRMLNLVKIDTGKNFIEKKCFFYNYDGSLKLCYDLELGSIEWNEGGINRYLCITNLDQVGFFPQKGRILIITNDNKQELRGYTLEGKLLFSTGGPLGFHMKFFTMEHEKVIVTCDGDKKNEDTYGRFRYNFYVDLDSGEFVKGGLAY